MNKSKFCIVAVGYNRPDAMKRLLESIANAEYEGDSIDLWISIDKGEKQMAIKKFAEEFVWKYGEKKIRAFPQRQGLKKHILQCGDISLEYQAVIILEDDITVSPAFYSYAKQCVLKYGNEESIAGISLYNHHINVGVGRFFEPEFKGYDIFLMQFAQSWGQCWTTKMWTDFRIWYTQNHQSCFSLDNHSLIDRIPNNILNWDEKSWMKYYMAYLVSENRFFVYPYVSLSTNHSEAGQHRDTTSSDYQVSLNSTIMKYRFPSIENAVKYDIYFERMGFPIPGYAIDQVEFDLYGNKTQFDNKKYLISKMKYDFDIIESFKLKYRPQEINCIYREPGDDIYIYDLSKHVKNNSHKKNYQCIRYDVRATGWRELIVLGLFELKEAALHKISKYLKRK